MAKEAGAPFRVLVIDDDADVADLVLAILSDDGYLVSTLTDIAHDSILVAVGKQEPDCILLDGGHTAGYGSSWAEAAYLAARERSVPTIMFSGHVGDLREAGAEETARARAADFAAILQKPFSLDDLLTAVATACGRSEPFNQSAQGDRERTVALVARLQEEGATDIRTSERREWATFRPQGWRRDLPALLVAAHGRLLGRMLRGRRDPQAHGPLLRVGRSHRRGICRREPAPTELATRRRSTTGRTISLSD